MLTLVPPRARGMTLIELMVGLAITALVLMMAAPSVGNWIANGKVRTTAESILNGLQYAKGEAVSRNARVRFQLTSTGGNDCVISTTGTSWVVNTDPNANESAVDSHCASLNSGAAEELLQTRTGREGTGVEVEATGPTVVFNGLGRPVMTPLATVQIDVRLPTAGNCAADGGEVNCLRILVTPQGQVRMCNPRMSITKPDDPQACPT